MWQRFTERARRVIFFAQEEAARLGENYVGTEHLLLALTREDDCVGARILDIMGVPLGHIRRDIERQVTRGHGNMGQDVQLTPRAKRIIDLAYEEARQLNTNYIGTEHLLLGMIGEGDGLAARVLLNLGADLAVARNIVQEMQEKEGGHDATAAPPSALMARVARRIPGRLHGTFEVQAEGTDGERPAASSGTKPTYAEALAALAETIARQEDPPLRVELDLKLAVDLARAACDGVTDLRAVGDLSAEQARALLAFARILKTTRQTALDEQRRVLHGRTVAMIFEKQSLRTRVTFETGVFQLGGHAIYLQPADISMGKREPVSDVARNLERWVDAIVARVYSHSTILDLAEHSRVPVINALCDREHPCQALTDFLTIREHRGEIAGQKVAYVGDGNNVAHSLLLLGAKLGAHVVVACPEGYEPLPEIVAEGRRDAEATSGSVSVTHDPEEACTGADVIYTDVWTSMGQESESAERARAFARFQVNEALAALAKPDYLFMHCLPAHRGEEASAGVVDGPNSVIFDQAENRLHAQKAVLAALLRSEPS